MQCSKQQKQKETYPRSKRGSRENRVTGPEPWAWNPAVPASCESRHGAAASSQTRAQARVYGGAGWGQRASSTHRGGADTGDPPTPDLSNHRTPSGQASRYDQSEDPSPVRRVGRGLWEMDDTPKRSFRRCPATQRAPASPSAKWAANAYKAPCSHRLVLQGLSTLAGLENSPPPIQAWILCPASPEPNWSPTVQSQADQTARWDLSEPLSRDWR